MIVSPNDAMSFTAFSGENTPEFKTLFEGDRYRELDRKQAYYDCKQHDRKFWDFDGRPINPKTMQPLLGIERSDFVPLAARRPSTPVRLGRVIVDSFTNLLFGESRFPIVRALGDAKTEDWLQTVVKIGKLSKKMIQARNMGGSTGSVGISWCFRDGKPRFDVHNAKNLFVHHWKDRSDLIPEHVSEVYLYSKVKWTGKSFDKIWYWFRRDWMPEADLVFKETVYDPQVEPTFVVDKEKSNFHGDGVTHFEWIQNLPSEDMDGLTDYEGLFETFDRVDLLMSVITKGAILNLDPTLILKMDAMEIQATGLKKGSDNSLAVGPEGDASYLELGGSSMTAGLEMVKELRRYTFETAQVVVADPNEIAAQGVSSVSIKAMFMPMLAKTDILREQYGHGMERMLQNLERVARERTMSTTAIQLVQVKQADGLPPKPATPAAVTDAPEPKGQHPSEAQDPIAAALEPLVGEELASPPPPVVESEVVEDEPTEEEILYTLDLPPKFTEIPKYDESGKPTGEFEIRKEERELGPGGVLDFNWPPYFQPTPTDQQTIVTALTTATGGKAVLSVETSTKNAASAFGVDPNEEWRRVQAEMANTAGAEAAMMDTAAAGGAVGDMNQLPPGAEEAEKPKDPMASAEELVPPLPKAEPKAPVDDSPVDIDLTKKG